MESGKEHVVATSSTLASFKPESLLEDELSQIKTKEQQETRGNLHEESVLLVTVCGQRPRHTCAESTRQHIETGAERQAGKTGGMKPISSPVPVQRNQFGRALTANLERGLVGATSRHAYEEMSQGTKKGARFRGVTRHKRTQRYEAHIWEAKKQIYLGGFDSEVMAAKSHDIMALKCKDTASEVLNFTREEYIDLAPFMPLITREDVIGALRAFSKAQALARTTSTSKTAKGRAPKPQAQASRPAAHALTRKLSISTPSSHPVAGPTDAPKPSVSPTKRGSPATSKEPWMSSYFPFTPKADRLERVAPTTPTAPLMRAPPPRELSLQTRPTEPGPCQDDNTPSPFGYIQQQLRATAKRSRRTFEVHLLDSETEDEEQEEAELAKRPTGADVAHMSDRSCSHLVAAASTVAMEASSSSTLLLEPSLTFSTSEESRLYEWMPVDRGHSGMEHTLNGTVLFRSPQQLAEQRAAAQAFTRQLNCVQPHAPSSQQDKSVGNNKLYCIPSDAISETKVPICPVTAIEFPSACWPCFA